MGTRFLIDTNILIEFQEQVLPSESQAYVASIIDTEFNVSVINKIELLGSRFVTKSTETFISLATVFELETSIVNKTIELRKIHKIKLPDAVIAATALIYNLTLITRNTRDFVNIQGLEILDPHKL